MKRCVLFKKLAGEKVQCLACNHKCIIPEGKSGVCGVRKNLSGELFSLVYGRPVSVSVDPIEKKPLFKFLPNTATYSFGTIGCNFKCSWCQNFEISQSRDFKEIKEISPLELAKNAAKSGCQSISYTYNEPAIFAEFVHDTAQYTSEFGLKNILVTNGYLTEETLDYLYNLIDAANIDLKSFREETYVKYCGAHLQPVLDCIRSMFSRGIHIEITTLIVPGVNDSEKEILDLANFISSISKDIPWHISRFFPYYKMKNKEPTDVDFLQKAYDIGKKAGLKNVYLGNI